MKYKVNIYTNQKTVHFGVDKLSPDVIEAVADIDYEGGDFVVDGEAVNIRTGEVLRLSSDGVWAFEKGK